jgi:hypothetical protein
MNPAGDVRSRRLRSAEERSMYRYNRITRIVRGFRPVALGLSVLLLGSCVGDFDLNAPLPVSCSTRRLNLSAVLYEEAKDFISVHYKERDHLSLLYAYYATVDAEELTRTIRYCDDFSPLMKSRGTDLIRAARILRKAAILNMRDGDPMVLVQLLGRQYDEVFKSDIH